MIKCDICGTAFAPKAHNSKRCSPKCVRRYRANWMSARHIPAPKRVVPCIECGTMTPMAQAPNRTTCSDKCVQIRLKRSAKKFKESPKGQAPSERRVDRVKAREASNRWRLKNGSQYYKNRRATDPSFRILGSLRARMGMVIHGSKKQAPTVALLGCSPDELRAWLEKQFKPGMSWANYGVKGWHIDHKRPLSSFQFLREDGSLDHDELSRAMNFTNLQPLWYWENILKSDKFVSI